VIDGDGQHEAVVVVGVLADKIHPPGGAEKPVLTVAECLGELIPDGLDSRL